MTYDNWKTTEPDDGAERPEEITDEMIDAQYERLGDALVSLGNGIDRLRASHDALLAAAKEALQLGAGHACSIRALRNAIAKADGSCKPYPGDEELAK
jgi:hypothetical protein